MRRLAILPLTLLCLLTIACATPPTALPQAAPQSAPTVAGVVPWQHVFHGAGGDSAIAIGEFQFAISMKDLLLTRQRTETIPGPTVTDTVWCNPAGECSKTRPTAPSDTIVPMPVVRGIPYGPYGILNAAAPPGIFTLSHDSYTPKNIVSRINYARANGMKLHLALTGGSHHNYMSIINDTLRFDRRKWEAKVQSFNTPAIKAAIAAGVADGTVIGNSVQDEPNVHGKGDGNTWGPFGTMNKVRVDSMCGYVKNIFPDLPVGVAHNYSAFEPAKSYKVCDYVLTQYASRLGSVIAYRDQALAMGKRDGHAIMFSINILNGGIQAARAPGKTTYAATDCPLSTTGGRGTYFPNCRMTADQIREKGKTLGAAGCAMLMWMYREDFMANPANQQAFRDVAAALAGQPGRSCRRS